MVVIFLKGVLACKWPLSILIAVNLKGSCLNVCGYCESLGRWGISKPGRHIPGVPSAKKGGALRRSHSTPSQPEEFLKYVFQTHIYMFNV